MNKIIIVVVLFQPEALTCPPCLKMNSKPIFNLCLWLVITHSWLSPLLMLILMPFDSRSSQSHWVILGFFKLGGWGGLRNQSRVLHDNSTHSLYTKQNQLLGRILHFKGRDRQISRRRDLCSCQAVTPPNPLHDHTVKDMMEEVPMETFPRIPTNGGCDVATDLVLRPSRRS